MFGEKAMKDTDLYWLAGLLEGEGCFSLRTRKDRPNYKGTPEIALQMTDKDVIERAAAIFERPMKVRGKPLRSGKIVYYTVVGGDAALALMKNLLPHMGQRRAARIREILQVAKERPGGVSGETQGRARFTNEQAADLRREYQRNPYRGAQSAIAKRHGVDTSTMSAILNGKTYATLTRK